MYYYPLSLLLLLNATTGLIFWSHFCVLMFYMQSVTKCCRFFFFFNFILFLNFTFYNDLLLCLGLINLILIYNNNLPPIFLPPFVSVANSYCRLSASSSWTKLSSCVSLRLLQYFPISYSPYALAWCLRLSTVLPPAAVLTWTLLQPHCLFSVPLNLAYMPLIRW